MHPTLLCTIKWTPPSTPCATPYNYSLQWTVSTMVWALLLMHSTLLCTIEWTPPYPLCYALQLFLTEITFWMDSILQCTCTIEWTPPYPLCYTLQLFPTVNSVNHGVGPLINALHPTLYVWVDSTLPPVLRPTTNYSLQQTVSTIEWAFLLMHSTLPRAIQWAPPYPYGCALQLFLTVITLFWLDSTLPCTMESESILRPCTAPYSYCLQRTKSAMEWTHFVVDSTLPLVLVLQLSLNDHLNTFVEPYTTCKTATCTCVWVCQVCICFA